ncbi:TetR family transcriptional regulator [Nakamurella sp. YIM 132087]|uniref:TetR family transcriptional regulator n=1 Tax=Nakamurella alba TaxID=2665158 RepID=A0A7K1FR24_9ACTN|nr:TetR/AcrR family transcriptional regulator [Nakamurella alba]MTD16598.1 TetR family transcriptional regulator [Nakamurella alba]
MGARGPGQRAGLTTRTVLDAALLLIDEQGGGPAALTMRALAERLGVRPNTIYSHVANKDDLVDLLLDDLLTRIPLPDPEAADPADELERVMLDTYRVLLQHPDWVPSFLQRQGSRGPAARALGEGMHLLLARTGVPAEDRQEVVRVLIVHTIGAAAFAAPASQVPQDLLDNGFRRSLGWLISGATQRPRRSSTSTS